MRARHSIPAFALYGETTAAGAVEALHIEDIASRSAPRLWEIAAHTHRGLCQMVFIFDGGALALLDESEVQVEAPAAILIPPAAVHAFQFRPGTRGQVLTVAEGLLAEAGGGAGDSAGEGPGDLFLAPRVISLSGGETAADLEFLLGQLLREFPTEAPGRDALVEALLRVILLRVARRHVRASRPVGRGQRRADAYARFRQFLEAHFREHWPVTRYAAALTLTEGRLNRLCRELGGNSAAELILERVLREARRRLIHTAAPVSQVAYDLGYQDPAYFSRIFKRRSGVTPRTFREQSALGRGSIRS